MEFKDKVVVITGASSGIGREIAIEFAKRRAVAVLLARNKEKLDRAVVQARGWSQRSASFVCDVSSEEQVKKTFGEIKDKFGQVDILINNAGFGIHQEFLNASIQDLESEMAVNYFGTVYCTKEVLPLMKKQGYGDIVNISSVIGRVTFNHMSGYSAAKFAVASLSESLHHELEDIHVHLICPGRIRTNFFDHPSFKKRNLDPKKMAHPRLVALAVINAIEKNKFEVFVPWWGRCVVLAYALFPRIVWWLYKRRN